jgi:hypothetical protein
MSPQLDLVLSRLGAYRLRENGRDRWRACCPAHGGKNPNALSVGVGADGEAVLLKCWHGCTVDEVCGALGIELQDLFPPRPAPGGGRAAPARRRMVSAGQALDLVDGEMLLCVVCASTMARGLPLPDSTRERLLIGAARVSMLRDEVRA